MTVSPPSSLTWVEEALRSVPSPSVAGTEKSPQPLRVTVVAPAEIIGGAETWLLQLLDAAGDRLQINAVLLSDGPLRQALEDRGVDVDIVATGRRPVELIRSSLVVARVLRRTPCHVVLANGVKAATVAVPACHLAGVPSVWVKHDFSHDRRLALLLGARADRVVAVSDAVAAATRRPDAFLIPPPRSARTPAGREEARAFWAGRGIPTGDSPTAVSLGRLVPYKGVDDAISALADPAARCWRLVVVGGDDPSCPGESDRLRAVAAAAGVADRVAFAGPVDEAGHWLAAFDALLLLTRADPDGFGREGFGLVALEAMQAGVPLVAVDDVPVLHRFASLAGVGVGAADPAAVAAALGQLNDPDVRRKAGAAGLRLVAEHPDADDCAALLARALAAAAGRLDLAPSVGPPLSVITTVLNEGQKIDGLLQALVPQLRDNDEVVVVDGGSTDDTPQRVAGWAAADSRIRLIERPGANIPAGRNAGIGVARHAHVACTDAGCVPDPGWLDAIRGPFAQVEMPDLVTGVYRVSTGSAMDEATAVACYPDPDEARHPRPLARLYGLVFGRTFDPTLPTGRSMAVTVEAWRAAGGFPEEVEAGEDVTFGRAVVRGGRRAALAVDAEVEWEQRPSLPATLRMYFGYGRGGARTRDRLVVARDLLRALCYLATPLLARRRGGRVVIVVGAAAYVSLPVRSALRRAAPLRLLWRLPIALAGKDLAKAAGCIRGLLDPPATSRRTRAAERAATPSLMKPEANPCRRTAPWIPPRP